MATEYLGGSDPVNREAVDRLAEEYENLRSTLPPGDPRTVEMTRVVNEARLRAAADPREASAWGLRLIRSRREGERIVGLASLQAAPAPGAFEEVLGLISGSATAFEMFHALLALESLAPLLSAADKAHAAEVLAVEESDPRGVGVAADSSLPSLIAQVRDTLAASPTRQS